MSNSTALIRDLLLNPSPENHLKLLEIIDDQEDQLLLDYAQQHLKEWDVKWERHGISDFERFSSPLIRKLDCWGNNLTSLPDCLGNLKVLDCRGNNLTSLPDNLENLEVLYCSYNNLTSLPENLENLEGLYCRGNPFPEGYLEEIQRKYPQLVIET
jgi:hypothetical protein